MPSNHPTFADQPILQPESQNYLVLTADTGCYGADLERYQVVIANAYHPDEALELASNAVDQCGDGCVPVIAYTAIELRMLADELDARALAPTRSYNLTLQMTEEQIDARNTR